MRSKSELANGLMMTLKSTAIWLMLSLSGSALAQTSEVEALVKQITVSLPQETAIYSFNEAAAAAAKPAPAWTTFQAKYSTWNWLWWNSYANVPHRAFGEAIAIPGIAQVTQTNVEDAAWKALDLLDALPGVPRNELRLARTFRVKNYWMISFIQVHNGMEVLWSEVELRLSTDGKLIAFGINTAPGLSLQRPRTLRKSSSLISAAQVGLPASAISSQSPTVTGPFILPIINGTNVDYRIVYRVDATDPQMRYPWTAWVDDNNTAVLRRELTIDLQDITGTVSGTIHPRVPQDALESRGFMFENMNITSLPSATATTVRTDAIGFYDVTLVAGSTSAVVTTSFDGSMVQVTNAAGAEASYTNVVPAPFPTVHDIAWSNTNSTIAERDAFYHINLMFSHVADIDDAFGLSFRSMYSKIDCEVNINDPGLIGNAYYSPAGHELAFFLGGMSGGINYENSATCPRTLYHEWGHSRHYEQYEIAGAPHSPAPSQLKEPVADITSAFFVRDPRHSLGLGGPGFVRRNADNMFVYPTDMGMLGSAHNQGQIFSGALWDMRDNLILTYGENPGSELSNELFHVALYGGASDPSSIIAWVEFLLDVLIADDNDNNLGNGTPNFNNIRTAFQAHGIWPTSLGADDPRLDVALVIDRSGSMSLDFPTRLFRAQDAAMSFIGLMGDNDRAGITNFDHAHDPALDHALVSLSAMNRTSLQNKLMMFTPGGATSVGLGLQHGQLILNPGLPTASQPQFILLLSDGEENTPPWAMPELALLPMSTKVYTIFLSSSAAGEALMQDLAAARDGVFLNAPTGDDLLATYVDMYALILQRDLILSYTQLINPLAGDAVAADTTTVSRFVCIAPGISEAQFLGLWIGKGTSSVEGRVELEDPFGQIINQSNINLYPGGNMVTLPKGQNLRIINPISGQWIMRIKAFGPQLSRTEIHGFCLVNSDIDLTMSSRSINPKERLYAVQAKLADNSSDISSPVLGAKVVTTSKGQQIVLRDDGKNFDGAANDGIYGALVGSVPDTTSANFQIEATFHAGGTECKRFGRITILNTPTSVNVPKPRGWSLTSLPVAPRDSSLQKLFPRAQAAFGFDPKEGYKLLQQLPTGVGFWLNQVSADTSLIQGAPVTAYSLALPRGWNLIGGLHNQAAIPSTKPDGVIQAMFRFDPSKGYEQTIRVLPGEAVWVNCAEACSLTMAQNSFSNLNQEAVLELPWQTTITATGELVGTAVNVSNVVIAGSNAGASTVVAPPLLPQFTTNLALWTLNFTAGPFASDTRATNTVKSMWVLEVDPHGNVPPPTPRNTIVSWDAATLGEGTWELRDGFDGTGAIRIADMRTTTSFVVTANSSQFFTIIFKPLITGVEDNKETSRLPGRFALYQNYPNPFNPETEIHYDLPKASRLTLTIYNLTGQIMRTLVDGIIPAGSHRTRWNGRDDQGRRVTGGIYFYRLQADDFVQVRKMILLP